MNAHAAKDSARFVAHAPVDKVVGGHHELARAKEGGRAVDAVSVSNSIPKEVPTERADACVPDVLEGHTNKVT